MPSPILKRPPCWTSTKELDSSIFAHIHHDAILLGSHLQGQSFIRTTYCLFTMLEYIKKQKLLPQIETKEKLEPLEKAMQGFHNLHWHAVEIKKLCESLAYAETTAKAHKDILALAAKFVSQLKEGEEILIPGGWKKFGGGTGGHAMCYKLIKQADKIIFLVYNTGAGIHYHLKKSGSKEKYLPVMAYELPLKTTDTRLSSFIAQLLKPQIMPLLKQFQKDPKFINENIYNAEKLYSIIAQIGALDGQKIDPKPYCKKYIKGQLSGTCAMRVLMPLLENEIGTDDFKTILYQLRLQSTIDHYQIQLKNKTLHTEMVETQLLKALEKLARTIRKFSETHLKKKPTLSESEIKEFLELQAIIIDGIRKEKLLNQIPERPFEPPTLRELKPLKLPEGTGVVISSYQHEINGHELKLRSEIPEPLEDKELESNPLAYLQAKHKALLENDQLRRSENVICNFENLMLSFPLFGKKCDEYWGRLSKSQAKEALNYLQAMLRIYGKHCEMMSGYPFAERVMAAASTLALASHISKSFFKSKEKFFRLKKNKTSEKDKSHEDDNDLEDDDKDLKNDESPPLVNIVMDRLCLLFLQDIYSVSAEPKWDKRYQELLAFYEKYKEVRLVYGRTSNEIALITSQQDESEHVGLGLEADARSSGMLKKLIALAPPSYQCGGAMENARENLYNLVNGNLKKYLNSKPFENLLFEFDFCLQMEELGYEFNAIKSGQFSYFMDCDFSAKEPTVHSNKRFERVVVKPNYSKKVVDDHVFNQKYESRIKIGAQETDLSTAYNIQNPVIKETLFPIASYILSNSNNRLLHFDSLRQSIPSLERPTFPVYSLPFTRLSMNPCRIIASKDFLESNFERYNFKDFQHTVHVNFFTPELLEMHLKSIPEFSSDLSKVLRDGLNFHQHGQFIDAGGIFCIRESYFLQKYFLSCPNKLRMQQAFNQLKYFDRYLDGKIEICLNLLGIKWDLKEAKERKEFQEQKERKDLKEASEILPPQTEVDKKKRQDKIEGQLKDLFDLFVLRTTLLDEKSLKKSPEILTKFLIAQFTRHLTAGLRGINSDVFLENEILHALHRFLPIVKNVFAGLEKKKKDEIISTVIDRALIPKVIKDYDGHIDIIVNFPYVQVNTQSKRNFLLDFSNGRIETPHHIECSLRPEFYTQKVINYFGNQSFVGKLYHYENYQVAEFEYNDIPHRIILDKKGSHIQRMFNYTWHELQDAGKFQLNADLALPRHFWEMSRRWWVDVNYSKPQSYYATDSLGNCLLKIEPKESYGYLIDQISELDSSGKETGYGLERQLPNSELFATLLKIEDPMFIEYWVPKSNFTAIPALKPKIVLKRYGIEFIVEKPGSYACEFVWKEDPNYRLALDDLKLIRNFQHQLILQHRKEKKKKTAVIPLQEFYVPIANGESTTETKGMKEIYAHDAAYYQLKLDLTNQIPRAALQTRAETDYFWDFSGEAQFLQIPLKGSSEATVYNPKTIKECLYLAYLYLGKQDPANAMHYLKKARKMGGLTGAEEEITLIQRIMESIPNSYEMLAHQEAETNSPEDLAVKLFAGILLAEFKQISLDNPLFDTSPSAPKSFKNYNESFKWKLTIDRIAFYNKGYRNALQELYSRYLKGRDNISEDLQLEPDRELILLRTVFKDRSHLKHSDKYNFGRRWQKLELIELQREANQLQKLQKEGKDNAASRVRLKKITEILNRGNRYFGAKHTLSKPTLQILKPESVTLEESEIALIFRSEIDHKDFNINTLSLDTQPETFLNFFRHFYAIATQKIKKEDKKNAEEECSILKDYLLNHIKIGLEKNNMLGGKQAITLSIIKIYILLYYVIENPEISWPQFEEHSSGRYVVENLFTAIVDKCAKIATDKPISINCGPAYVFDEPGWLPKAVKLEAKESATQGQYTPIHCHLIKPVNLPDFSKSFDLTGFTNVYRRIERFPDEPLPPKPKKRFSFSFKKKSYPEIDTTQRKSSFHLGIKSLKEDFFQQMAQNFEKDLKEGTQINYIKRKQFAFAVQTFRSKKTRRELHKKITGVLTKEALELKKQQAELIAAANIALMGKKAPLDTALQTAGRVRRSLGFHDLLELYIRNDLDYLKARTLLDTKEAIELYQKIHNYFLAATHHQQSEEVVKALQAVPSNKQDPEFNPRLQILADKISETRCFNPEQHPALLAFEYCNKISIRDNQFQMLSKLLVQGTEGYANLVQQLIMGGGKSKVLLPLLALLKANGSNLSIIEVPLDLFETNLADMRATTQQLFSKQAQPFVFTRDSKHDVATLKALYKKLKQIMNDREYLVTTAESVQALELKYWELFEAKPKLSAIPTINELANYQEWAGQVTTLEKILKLFKERGDALIDEIDSNLDPKKELNYTLGASQLIDEDHLKTIQEIYNLFKHVETKIVTENGDTLVINLEQVMLGKTSISKEEDWHKLFIALSKILVDHPESPLNKAPLNEFTRGLKPEEKQELFLYLYHDFLDEDDHESWSKITKPKFVTALTKKLDKDRMGIIKGELEFLRLTLKKKVFEHFGPPKSPKYVESMDVSIPYIANNTPNPRAKFGSSFETVNYTLALHLQNEKLSTSAIQEFLQEFHKRADLEIVQSRSQIDFDNTEAARQFFAMTQIRLSSIHPSDDLTPYQKLWFENTVTRDHCLLHYVLKKIKHDPTILRSNAVNHASIYRSRQGFTGTPWNFRCYHQDMTFKEEESFGTDGQTFDHIISKKTKVFSANGRTPETLIKSVMEKRRVQKDNNAKKIHAIIDVGALFKGKKNEEVVHLIVLNLLLQKNNDIRYILYFDDNNNLTAFPVEILDKLKKEDKEKIQTGTLSPTDIKRLLEVEFKKIKPKVIGSSDPQVIQAETDCQPSQLFTYYDQRHTTGTDIKQPLNSLGILTVDVDTSARGFAQGAMRMRDLARTQDIEVMLSEGMHAETQPKIESVIDKLLKNQWQQLAEYHFYAALQKMHNVIREDFKKRIYEEQDVKKKHELYDIFRDVFVTTQVHNPFAQFTEIATPKGCDKILKELAEKYLTDWQKALAQAKIDHKPDEPTVSKTIFKIASDSVQFCLKNRKHLPRQGEDSVVQTQREKEQEVKPEVEMLLHAGPGYVSANGLSEWDGIPFVPFTKTDRSIDWYNYKKIQVSNYEDPKYYKTWLLNNMLETSLVKANFSFKENLYVSEDFRDTYKGQRDRMALKKPLNFVLTVKTPDGLKAMLITQEEAWQFAGLIEKHRVAFQNSGYDAWVLSPQGTMLAATKSTIDHPEYPELKEQIAFFNADLDYLMKNIGELNWLKEKQPQKLSYLARVGLKTYPEKESLWKAFNQSLESVEIIQLLVHCIQTSNPVELKNQLIKLEATTATTLQKSILNSNTPKGISLLSLAIQIGDLRSAQLLLDTGKIDVLKPDQQKCIPLAHALKTQNKAMVDLLLKHSLPEPSDSNTWAMLLGLAAEYRDEALFETFSKHIMAMTESERDAIIDAVPQGLSITPQTQLTHLL